MARHPTARPALAAGMSLLILLSSSCSKGHQRYPVRGQFLFEGKPAPGASVVFHLVGGDLQSPKPSGVVADDGSYSLATYPFGDGAPPGEYRVAIVWLDGDRRREDGTIPNKLPSRYATPASSGLDARVNDGPTEVPAFRLTK